MLSEWWFSSHCLCYTSLTPRLAAISHQHPSLLFTTSRTELTWLSQLSSLLLLGTARADNTVHSRMLTVSAAMCSCHPATGCVTPFIKKRLPQPRALFREPLPSNGSTRYNIYRFVKKVIFVTAFSIIKQNISALFFVFIPWALVKGKNSVRGTLSCGFLREEVFNQ
jgi:hypothetical protein